MAWERLIMGGAQSFHAEKNLKKKKKNFDGWQSRSNKLSRGHKTVIETL